jgi:hypothetical protein
MFKNTRPLQLLITYCGFEDKFQINKVIYAFIKSFLITYFCKSIELPLNNFL